MEYEDTNLFAFKTTNAKKRREIDQVITSAVCRERTAELSPMTPKEPLFPGWSTLAVGSV